MQVVSCAPGAVSRQVLECFAFVVLVLWAGLEAAAVSSPVLLLLSAVVFGALSIWFLSQGRKLSQGLIAALGFWIFIDWCVNYGSVGLSLPASALLLLAGFDSKEISLLFATPLLRGHALRILFVATFLVTTLQALDQAIVRPNFGYSIEALRSLFAGPGLLVVGLALGLLLKCREFKLPFVSKCRLLSLTIFVVLPFEQALKHEYFYFFAGSYSYLVHPEFVCATDMLLLFCALTLFRLIRDEKQLTPLSMFWALFLSLAVFVAVVCNPPLHFDFAYEKSIAALSFLVTSPHAFFFGAGNNWNQQLVQLPWAQAIAERRALSAPLSGPLVFAAQYGVLACALFLFLVGTRLRGILFNQSQINWYSVVLLSSFLFLPAATSIITLVFVIGLASQHALDVGRIEKQTLLSTTADRAVQAFLTLGMLVVVSWASFQSIVVARKLAQLEKSTNSLENRHKLQVSADFIKKLVVAEDILYFEHHGIDWARLKWILKDALLKGRVDRGASTISMQLAKVALVDYDKTLSRKLRQIIAALIIESKYNKEVILERYLAVVSFGDGAYGVDAAATHYFQTPAAKLSNEQQMLLVLSIEDPEHFNPKITPMPKPVLLRQKHIQSQLSVFSRALDPWLSANYSMRH